MLIKLSVSTKGFADIVNITPRIEGVIKESGIKEGLVCVFVPGSTAAVTTMEYESGLVKDLKQAFERMAPQGRPYAHDQKWGDGNGFSHVRASILGPSVCLPIRAGRMSLGTWQQVVLVDFDNRPRTREVLIKILKDVKK